MEYRIKIDKIDDLSRVNRNESNDEFSILGECADERALKMFRTFWGEYFGDYFSFEISIKDWRGRETKIN